MTHLVIEEWNFISTESERKIGPITKNGSIIYSWNSTKVFLLVLTQNKWQFNRKNPQNLSGSYRSSRSSNDNYINNGGDLPRTP